jgi:L,D-transpeptidase ErfK/SrfK
MPAIAPGTPDADTLVMHGTRPGPVSSLALHAAILAMAAVALCGAARLDDRCRTVVGDRWIHIVSRGETWTTISARVGVDPEVIARRNGLTTRVPLKVGDALGIDNRHIVPMAEYGDDLVINLPQRMLFHYQDGAVRAHYPVAVGRPDWPTPLGAFSIATLEADPTWDVPVSIQEEMRRAGKPVLKKVAPGPTNPLGSYWIGLSVGSIGVHGTTAPSSIYRFATHGCIRLHPEDVEDLFHHLDVGVRGRIIYEPVMVAFDAGEVFVEVHRDAYRKAGDPYLRAMELLDRAGLAKLADPAAVARVVKEAEGLAVAVTARQ